MDDATGDDATRPCYRFYFRVGEQHPTRWQRQPGNPSVNREEIAAGPPVPPTKPGAIKIGG